MGYPRPLLRVELRQLRRNAARTWIMMLLVAVPVAAIVGGSTLAKVTTPTAAELKVNAMGRAQLHAGPFRDETSLQRAVDLLPADAERLTIRTDRVPLFLPGRRVAARAIQVDAAGMEAGGLAEGMWRLEQGRAPSKTDEIALSSTVLSALECSLGERVRLAEHECTITGVVVDPENTALSLALCVPELEVPLRGSRLLVGLAESDAPALAEHLRGAGLTVSERSSVSGPDGFEQFAIFVIGSIGLFEAALIIAAAFAVGLRRRQREIGLLGATGAPPGGMGRALVASAAVLAVGGGLLGVGMGAGAAAAVLPFVDAWNDRRNGAFAVVPEHILSALALGILAAVLAVVLPARSAIRLPVRTALGGGRPPSARSGRWLAAGALMIAVGVVLLLLAVGAKSERFTGLALIGGSIISVLGFGTCSPWILDRLARRAARLPLAWRLAVRDAGRFRARNGPVVTAVTAGMAISVTVAAMLASVLALPGANARMMRDDWLVVEGPGAEEVSQDLAVELNALTRTPLRAVHSAGQRIRADFSLTTRDGTRMSWIACGGEDLLSALDVTDGAPAFEAGSMLSLFPDADPDSVRLVGHAGSALSVPDLVEAEADPCHASPSFVLSATELETYGFEPGPPPGHDLFPWVLRIDRTVDASTLEQARKIAARVPGTTVDADRLHPSPKSMFYRTILAICFATGLIVLLIATALSAVESAADARLLTSVGASPALLRTHLAARAGYLALLGCILAIPAGMLPAIGLSSLSGGMLTLTIPWAEILITVLGLPAAAYALVWCFATARTALARGRARGEALSVRPLGV